MLTPLLYYTVLLQNATGDVKVYSARTALLLWPNLVTEYWERQQPSKRTMNPLVIGKGKVATRVSMFDDEASEGFEVSVINQPVWVFVLSLASNLSYQWC